MKPSTFFGDGSLRTVLQAMNESIIIFFLSLILLFDSPDNLVIEAGKM